MVTGAVEIEEGADVTAGRGYVASPQVKTIIAAVARLKEHGRTDAFGDAVTAAADELAAEVESRDEKVSLAELRMSGLKTRLESADEIAKELRGLLFELADMAGRDKVGDLGPPSRSRSQGILAGVLGGDFDPIWDLPDDRR